MIDLTSEQVDELRTQLPEIDYDWILKRIKALKSNPKHQQNAGNVAIEEWHEIQEVRLVNLALRRYGSHD